MATDAAITNAQHRRARARGPAVQRFADATQLARKRGATSVLFHGRAALSDRVSTRLFFELAAARWQGASEAPEHLAQYLVGLEQCGQPATVLDVGTGAGASAAAAAKRWPSSEVVGVDLSRAMLRRARARHQAPNPHVPVVVCRPAAVPRQQRRPRHAAARRCVSARDPPRGQGGGARDVGVQARRLPAPRRLGPLDCSRVLCRGARVGGWRALDAAPKGRVEIGEHLAGSPGFAGAHPPPAVPWGTQARAYSASLRPAGGRRRGEPPTQFVVFAQGRTGSTLLVDLLHSIPAVHCDEEIRTAPVRFPRQWVAGHRARHRTQAYGFKVKIYQLTDVQGIRDVGRWVQHMRSDGWEIIHLFRRNLLRHVISNIAADQRGSFTYRGSAPPALTPLHIEPDHLVRWMRTREAVGLQELVALDGFPTLPVCEDDLAEGDSHQARLDRLTEARRLPASVARTSVRRAGGGPLSDLLANADEVARALEGTPWERYLE